MRRETRIPIMIDFLTFSTSGNPFAHIESEPEKSVSQKTRLINLHSAIAADKSQMQMLIRHCFEDEIHSINFTSASSNIDTGGHLFQIMFAKAQQMFDQAIVTNPAGDWPESSLFLRFNLIREFNFKQYE